MHKRPGCCETLPVDLARPARAAETQKRGQTEAKIQEQTVRHTTETSGRGNSEDDAVGSCRGRVARLLSTPLPAALRQRQAQPSPNQQVPDTSGRTKYLCLRSPAAFFLAIHPGTARSPSQEQLDRILQPARGGTCSRRRASSPAPAMAMVASTSFTYHKPRFAVVCRKNRDGGRDRERERDKEKEHKHPFKVVEITPPPRCLGVRCFPTNIHCGESVTIEGQAYTVSAVTHRYQLRKGRYEPSEKRLDVLSTGRYILNLYLQNLLDQS